MQVVIRNFIKLLSTGAFQSYCTLEEMSEYKWNQLLYIAKINDVEDFIISGIIYSDNSSNNIIPMYLWDGFGFRHARSGGSSFPQSSPSLSATDSCCAVQRTKQPLGLGRTATI